MASVEYTAARNVSAGHSLGVVYDMDFTASRIQRRHQTVRRVARALDGSQETLRYRGDELFDVTVNEVLHADIPLWREFLESVDGGEQFTFDAYGTEVSPDNIENCVMDTNVYTE